MPKKSKKIIQNSLEEIKAQNTIFLDLSKLNSFTDFSHNIRNFIPPHVSHKR